MKNNFSTKTLPIGSLGILSVSIPVITFTGKKPGKKIIITATVHGNETTSLFVLHELISLLRTCGLKEGEIVIVPVVNPLGLAFGTRREPLDEENLNREFPGSLSKSLGKRITSTVWNEIQDGDFIIDLHTFTSRQCTFTGVMVKTNTRIDEEVIRIMRQIRPDCVWLIDMSRDEDKRFYGALDVVAASKNIPALTLEIERLTNVSDSKITRYASSIMRALYELRVIDLPGGGISKSEKNGISVFEGHYLYCDKAGLFFPSVSILEKINTHSLLGEITDITTFEKSNIISPMDGTILTIRYKDFVRTGSKLASIGTYAGPL